MSPWLSQHCLHSKHIGGNEMKRNIATEELRAEGEA